MIENILNGTQHKIDPIPDIDNPSKYQEHVASIVKEFDKDCIIVTGNKYAADCFPGFKILKPKKERKVCGSELRRGISEGEDWKQFIPECNWEIFRKEGIDKMIKENNKPKEQILSSETIFEGRYISKVEKRIVKLINGNEVVREVVTVPSAVAILPVTKDNHVIMVRQFRSAIEKDILEIPAGVIDKEETIIQTAERELLEEVGVKGKLTKICDYHPSGGFANYTITIYYALVESEGESKPDEDELLEIVKMPIEEAYSMILDGKLTDAKTQISIRHYFNEVYNK